MSAISKALSGRTALVTGASRGIGRGLAIGLGELGARVLITGRKKETLEETAGQVRAAGGECETFAVDHSSDDAVEDLFAELRSRFDADGTKLDFLVNNAYSAVSFLIESRNIPAWRKNVQNPSEEDVTSRPGEMWDMINNVGLRNNFICFTYAMRQFEAQKSGVIVNISSFGGLFPLFDIAYAVGKSANDRMTSEFARVAPPGVVCFSLYPGMVATEAFKEALASGSMSTTPNSSPLQEWSAESPLFVGRALARGLAQEKMVKGMNGRIVIAAELGAKVKAKDENGRTPLSIRSVRYFFLKAMPFLVNSPLRFLIPNIYFPLSQLQKRSGVIKLW